MTREAKAIDISDLPELVRVVEEVRSTNEPWILRRAGEDLAILTPSNRRRKRRSLGGKTQADNEAFRSSAGSWKDVDTDKLVAEIHEGIYFGRDPHAYEAGF